MNLKKVLSVSVAALFATIVMIMMMPAQSAKAAMPTETWSYDAATDTITVNCTIPTSVPIGEPATGEMELYGEDATGHIEFFATIFGAVNPEFGFQFGGKQWHRADLLNENYIVGAEYGFILFGHATTAFAEGDPLPKIVVDGVEFQSVVSTGKEFFICISFGVTDENGNFIGGDFGGSSAGTSEPDMTTVNVAGATFNTWDEIIVNTPALTSEALKKVNENNNDLLHVNITGKEDKTVPAAALQAMGKSSIGGLHVFIGESDAVTFLNSMDYSKYTGMNFKHDDVITDNSRTIDFTSKGKLNASLMFHTVIAPNTSAKVYKVVDGKEVYVNTWISQENGRFCFMIDELAKYVIKY